MFFLSSIGTIDIVIMHLFSTMKQSFILTELEKSGITVYDIVVILSV